jgi:hypothetical protein
MFLISGCATPYDLTDPASAHQIVDLWETNDANGTTWLRLYEDGTVHETIQVGGTTIEINIETRWTLHGSNLSICPAEPDIDHPCSASRIRSLSSRSLVLEDDQRRHVTTYKRKISYN